MAFLYGAVTRQSDERLELSFVPFQREKSMPAFLGCVGCASTVGTVALIAILIVPSAIGAVLLSIKEEWFPASLFAGFAAILFWCGFQSVFGSLSGSEWIHVDRSTATFTRLRQPFGSWTRPRPVESWSLAEIEALQLSYVGLQVKSYFIWGPDSNGFYIDQRHHVYHFNLILTDETVHLVTTDDSEWLRKMASQVSEFCNLPIIDDLNHEDSDTVEK
ncbi:MAG: hypothetical protein O2820_05790 [Planctomycetota bacterium]|nr:hypothetical protein [Planctomycetota bacterium]